ncbi:UDP-N-acetylmuramoyl-L-alanine--D-glutamate ligase [Hyphomicrobium methylovorum]|uniref:UDP-N-acetylmuramoyl-L-alanine--D-glutamate ligase n=1 Tax=Hyphomicrobium methylovorum TaxID=84 RepID=UPI0015E6830D|nr:UDP-N-acetylmuramoyl-L-alanine--D-glutamate ligase [Hyphomicrobium methylovorum]MBA2126558.1 UDP-N-acetylmuramoyl-L-alanine--D-glutamate ligase [Hyphomicrobium methylovorum]
MIRATTFNGQTVAVFGLGSSGIAAAKALVEGGAHVEAWDDGAAGREAAIRAGVPVLDLRAADWSRFSALVLAPGVPLTHPVPHWTVEKARAHGVEIIGDIEIFARERAARAGSAPFIAVTGTNGKSTTSALIGHILAFSGRDVQLGGNIGRAILTLDEPQRTRFYVVEMSSFQIDLTPTLSPTVGVMLNVTPDHLDRHGTIDRYAAIKERIVEGAEVAAVGIDDSFTLEMLKRRIERGAAIAFSAEKSIAPGYSILDGTIVCSNREGLAVKLGALDGIATLRGKHNAQNALAAVAAVRECLNWIGESSDLDWQGALSSFPGLPHRMEEIGRAGNAVFINDSKATNADSTEKALLSFPKNVFWIAGGRAKAGGIEPLAPYFGGITKAYLIGESAEDFAATLEGKVPFEMSGTLDAALTAATRDASEIGDTKSIVLLSPACASYDQFKNFEARGDSFRSLVAALPGIVMRRAAP